MSIQDWQKLAAYEARRQIRMGWTVVDEADLTQEGLVAIWAHANKGGSLDRALLRVIARRRMLIVLIHGRRRSWTCRVHSTKDNRKRHQRAAARGHLFAGDGFLAFERQSDTDGEDTAASLVQAFDPTPDIEDALSYWQIVGRYEEQAGRAVRTSGKSRQAQQQLEQRMVKWCRTNARPFDPGFVDATSAVAQ